MSEAGRACPADYRYPAAALRHEPDMHAETLYVAGGLYGNRRALDTIESMVAAEKEPTTVAFNGDFHWFDAVPEWFSEVDRRLKPHALTRGNVETELGRTYDLGTGCGCAYPGTVDSDTVERSNRILVRLRRCVEALPGLRDRLASLPMTLVAAVGSTRVGIVHGDAEALAGWRFAPDHLDSPASRVWLEGVRAASGVDVYASTHTCLPVLREFALETGRLTIINNGAAGMPNFAGTTYGVLTRIGLRPSPHRALYGVERDGVFIQALAVPYDQQRWLREFVAAWPPGSPAYESYLHRMVEGGRFVERDASARAIAVAPAMRCDRARRSAGVCA